MKRNMNKAAADGQKIAGKCQQRDLYADDIYQLLDAVRKTQPVTNEIYDAVCNAYYAGLSIGTRTARG